MRLKISPTIPRSEQWEIKGEDGSWDSPYRVFSMVKMDCTSAWVRARL